MATVTVPFLPLDGNAPPTFGVSSFDSRPLFPTQHWLGAHEAGAWTDIWFTNHVAQAVIGAALVIGLWLWVAHNQKVVPGRKQFAGEFLYDLVRNTIARDALGHDYRKYVPYLLGLFSFILVNNLFGETFLFMFPTFSKIGFPYALAILSWLLYNGAGIRKWGFGTYLKKMTMPAGVPGWLLPLIIPLEIISNFVARPVTLALRLFANLFAGHLVIMVFVVGGGWLLTVTNNWVYNVAGAVSLSFSFAIFALELLVGALQAYIFTVLTAQYVASAIADEH